MSREKERREKRGRERERKRESWRGREREICSAENLEKLIHP